MIEYRDSFDQHRHLENLRSRYLAFLFTVAFAGRGLIGSILNKASYDYYFPIFTSMIIALISLAIIFYLSSLLNSMKAYFVHYEGIYRVIRKSYLNDEIEETLNIRKHSPDWKAIARER